MLRQILFLLTYFGLMPAVVVSPFAGVLLYKWMEYLTPADAYFVSLLPDKLSFTMAAVTFAMWLVRENKRLPRAPLVFWILITYFLWTNFSSLFALAPQAGAFKWERTDKVIGFSILMAQMMSTSVRLEAFAWVQVICIAFTAIPGMLKTIYWGGGGLVVIGVGGSFVDDRVAFAVVLPMILPLALFLTRRTTLLPRSRATTFGLYGVIAACLVSLVGTFARTAVFSGGTALILLVGKARNKIWMFLAALAVVVTLFELAPGSWFQRIDTTTTYQKDASAENRIAAWEWSWRMALEHPLVGGGYGVFSLNKMPGEDGYLEAHNIFFEVVAQHGFVGLALFVWLIAAAYRSCGTVRRLTARNEDLAWANDLAGMLQISLLVFVAGGTFISIATSPFLFDLVPMIVGLRSIVERERVRPRVRTLAVPMPFAPPTASGPAVS